MITDFNEIIDEKDRELYAACREILDNWFLKSQGIHAHKKDHKLHECWMDEQKQMATTFDEVLDEVMERTNQSYEESFENAETSLYADWIDCFQRLIIINNKRDSLRTKH